MELINNSAVIVFDLDDTLFPERDFVLGGFHAVGAFLGVESRFYELAAQHFERGERGAIFDAVLAEMEIPKTPELIKNLVAVYRGHTPTLALGETEASLLRALRQAGKKLGIITDGYLAEQQKKVEALGLQSFVDAVIYSDTWGRSAWKPSPVPFRELEKALHVSAADCVYIGDNPEKDFLGARRAGWSSVRLRLPAREHSSDPATGIYAPDVEIPAFTTLFPNS
ncbi:MAG: HAD family hydrolase [Puniceicoccales bacterium]|jgi:putative hydrolase of the HAD superfamily|nr:HAD family hydrolase [Puniceicoccales bacterium]